MKLYFTNYSPINFDFCRLMKPALIDNELKKKTVYFLAVILLAALLFSAIRFSQSQKSAAAVHVHSTPESSVQPAPVKELKPDKTTIQHIRHSKPRKR